MFGFIAVWHVFKCKSVKKIGKLFLCK